VVRVCRDMTSLPWLAVVLVVAWLVLRLALAITGTLLHLLWVGALLVLVLWLVDRVRQV